MTGKDKQKAYFEKLVKVVDTPIYTTQNWRQGNEWKPGKQVKIGGVLPIDHRTIGSNEPVFELDAASYAQNYRLTMMIVNVLKEKGIDYYPFWSGNKSIHTHVFLDVQITNKDIMALVQEAVDKGCNIWKEIRLHFVREILTEAGINTDMIGQGKVVDLAKLAWNDVDGKATLIRACGGANKKLKADGSVYCAWKTYFKEIPEKKPKETKVPFSYENVEYPDKLIPYKFPEENLAIIAQKYLRDLTPKMLKDREIIDFKGKYLTTPCCQKIREGTKAGIRNQGAKILSIAAKLDKVSLAQAEQLMEEYVSDCSQAPTKYDPIEAKQWLKWIYDQKKPYWTCAHAVAMGMCNPVGCPFHEQKYKDELKYLDVDTPLELIQQILDKLIVGETKLKMQLFLLYLTKEFEPEWCILLDGPAASGKSHVMKAVAEMFGPEEEAYFAYSRFTESSLNHMEDLAQEWQNKIVIIEELQGAKRVVEQLRVAISEGKLTLVETVESLKEGGLKGHKTTTKTISFKGVLFVTCNAEEFDEGEQLKSRSWILNTDQSKEQTRDIVNHYIKGLSVKHKLASEIPELEGIRNSLKLLERPDYVVFPFSDELKQFIPVGNVRARRDVKKMITLIKASAYLHQKRRRWYLDKNNKRVLVADWRDIGTVFGYAGDSLQASSQGVGTRDLELYDLIKDGIAKSPSGLISFGIADVNRWCSLGQGSSRKLMSSLVAAGFFENTVPPPGKAVYELTAVSPEYMGDVVDFSSKRIAGQEKLIDEWVKENEA